MIFARYSDGVRPVAHEARLSRHALGISIALADRAEALIWPFSECHLQQIAGEAQLHRAKDGLDTGERLIADHAELAQELGVDLRRLRRGRVGEADGWRIARWAALALLLIGLFLYAGVPLLSRLLLPVMPYSWEVALGDRVEPLVRANLGQGGPARACGKPDGAGRRALNALTERLAREADLPGPLTIEAIPVKAVNAFALPGGRIFLLDGLIQQSRTPDELAAVLAHEIGHVRHRHATQQMLESGLIWGAIALLAGDVSGGGLIAGLGQTLLGSAYSREHEREADEASVTIMRDAGGNPKALNAFFEQVRKEEARLGSEGRLLSLLSSHPLTETRIAHVEALTAALPDPKKPILSAEQWADLRGICRE